MKIKDIQESTVAGSIASVAKPLGELQTRSKPEKAPKVTKGKKYANTISEGAMKELLYNLKHMDADEFQKVYKKTKDFFQKTDKPAASPKQPSAPSSKTGSQVWHDTGYTDKKVVKKADEPIQEDELKEEDLIILPGMIRNKDKSFVPREHDRRDHEVEMARSDVYAAAKDAIRILKVLENKTEDEGLMGWQQSYITLAADYLNSVADSLEYDSISNEGAGVIAGGMSNFEEGRYYNPLDHEREEQQAYDDEREDFKRREQNAGIEQESNNYAVAIDGRVWKVFGDKNQAENIARSLVRKGKKATVHLTGASISEEQIPMFTPESKLAEKKNTPYKVWPTTSTKSTPVSEENPGLWANIHAKRERIKKGSGERMRKPGSKGAPTSQAFKQSQKTSKK